jgi:hypothetical protein
MEYTCSFIGDVFDLCDEGGDNCNLIGHQAYCESFLKS